MFSIKLKIVFAYTLIFGIILTLFAYIIYQSTEKAELARLDSKLKGYSILLQSEIEEQSMEDNGFRYSEFKIIPTEGLKRSHFQLLDNNGESVLGDTVLTYSDKTFVNSILNEQEKFDRIKIGRHHARVYLSAVEINEKTDHILVVSSSLEEVKDDLERLLLIFFIVIPAGLILAGTSAFIIAKNAFKPINKMITTANEISAYSLDKRLIVPNANDEVQALSITLNSMIERLDKTFKSHRQFIADASHEIRTPLTVIQTELELALKKMPGGATKKSINISLTEIENLNKMTNSLLTLAKIDAKKNKVELSNVRLDELILECSQLLKVNAEQKRNKINIVIDDVIEFNCDRGKIKSVILNIIDNAIKYSGNEKEITISLSKEYSEWIAIKIMDNGPGIPVRDIPHIFERFYRSNEIRADVEGNGLGLAIVKEFVEMHKGKISVKSIPGETIFLVILPVLNNI
ncbi:MAG TPA: HAMP domain-containing sensor histidine kinase [Ignavibacteriaceae bacterium]|nr:HAMP domain-containing sensor histidine kinase [Ignavibacteriaceae bacterium]